MAIELAAAIVPKIIPSHLWEALSILDNFSPFQFTKKKKEIMNISRTNFVLRGAEVRNAIKQTIPNGLRWSGKPQRTRISIKYQNSFVFYRGTRPGIFQIYHNSDSGRSQQKTNRCRCALRRVLPLLKIIFVFVRCNKIKKYVNFVPPFYPVIKREVVILKTTQEYMKINRTLYICTMSK